jgi:hypothetical protein
MKADIHPIQLLILTVAGWVNREQQRAIECQGRSVVGLHRWPW